MDGGYWNIGNNGSFNFTGDFEYCRSFLGDIVPWSLTVYLSIIVIAKIANVLLLFAIYKDPLKCLRNPSAYFIANLSIADLLILLFHFEELLASQTTYKSTFCLPGAWGTFHGIFGGFVYFLTFPSVTVLALERYVSVAHPLWHQVKVTSRLCCTWIVVLWLFNCVVAGITAYFFNVLIVVGYSSVFYLTTVLVYLLAFISIRKKHLSLETDTSKSEIIKQMIKLRLRNQNRFLTTVLIVNIILIFGIIPALIVWPLKNMVGEGTLSATTFAILFHTVDISFLINMASNPFLYIWRLPKYRKTFFVMYCCKK
jgi:hypothetical protein